MATLEKLAETVVPNYIDPVPPIPTLRVWFKDIPQFKSNPAAKRGGGTVFYSVAAVEKYFRARIMGAA